MEENNQLQVEAGEVDDNMGEFEDLEEDEPLANPWDTATDGEDEEEMEEEDLPEENQNDDWTWGVQLPLHSAASRGDIDAIRRHLEEGVGVDGDYPDATPLSIAASRGNLSIVQILLAAGANPNRRLTSGLGTPLHDACLKGMTAIARLLIQKGADPEMQNLLGQTAVFICAAYGRLETAKMLVEEFHVNLAHKDHRGNTAFDVANQCGLLQVALFLWKHAPNVADRSILPLRHRRTGVWSRVYLTGDLPGPRIDPILKYVRFYRKKSSPRTLAARLKGLDNTAGIPEGEKEEQECMEEEIDFDDPEVIRNCMGDHKSLVLSPTKIGRCLQKEGDFILRYVSKDNMDVVDSSAQTDRPWNPKSGPPIGYFEVYILNAGIEKIVAVGLADGRYRLDRDLPGWNLISYGYHSDDGKVFSSHGNGVSWGPKFGTGDVVGCGVNFQTGEVFYTLNGRFLGVANREPPDYFRSLYPTVGMASRGAVVRFNFGGSPFVFNFQVPVLNFQKVGIVEPIARARCQLVVTPSVTSTALPLPGSLKGTALPSNLYSISLPPSITERDNDLYIHDLTYRPSLPQVRATTGGCYSHLFFTTTIESDLFVVHDTRYQAGTVPCYPLYGPLSELLIKKLDTKTWNWSSHIINLSHLTPLPYLILSEGYTLPTVNKKIYFLNSPRSSFYVDTETMTAHALKSPDGSTIEFKLGATCGLPSGSNIVCFGKEARVESLCARYRIKNPMGEDEESTHIPAVGLDPLDDHFSNMLDTQVWLFDTQENVWLQVQTSGTIPGSRSRVGICSDPGNKVFIYGGINGGNPTSDLEILTLNQDVAQSGDPMVRFLDSEELNDFQIKCLSTSSSSSSSSASTGTFRANKIVLYCRSNYFRELLKKDPEVKEIEMKESYHLIFHWVRYLYSNVVSPNLNDSSYRDFLNLIEQYAPEHSERISQLLLLTRCEVPSLVSRQIHEYGFCSKLFTDIEFQFVVASPSSASSSVRGHKAIICARSDYFHALCLGRLSTHSDTIVFDEASSIDFEPFCAVLEYLYLYDAVSDTQEINAEATTGSGADLFGGYVEKIGHQIVEVLVLARRFAIEGLSSLLEKVVSLNLNEENVVSLLTLSEELELQVLSRACVRTITAIKKRKNGF